MNNEKQFGFLINIKRNWIFTKSCADLHAENYNLIGVEVLYAETLPGLDNILAPNEEFVGEIIEITGTKAKVNTNEGEKEYALNELFIRKTKFNIGNYLTFATSQQKSDEVLRIIESKRSDIYNPKVLFSEINNIARALFTDKGSLLIFQNKEGFCFTVDSTPLVIANTIELKTPTFIFDPAATKTINTYPDNGLNNFGPYDSSIFDIKSPNVLQSFFQTLKTAYHSQGIFKKDYRKSTIYTA